MLTFGWNSVMTSVLPFDPSSILLLPVGVKLVRNRTTRLHSTTNNLKCAKFYDFYEYGLDTRANRCQTRHRSNAGISLHAFSVSES